jgi:hypothetical protein
MSFHTALDVSLRSVAICIVDDEGTTGLEIIKHEMGGRPKQQGTYCWVKWSKE